MAKSWSAFAASAEAGEEKMLSWPDGRGSTINRIHKTRCRLLLQRTKLDCHPAKDFPFHCYCYVKDVEVLHVAIS
jgi:hypothetical protein